MNQGFNKREDSYVKFNREFVDELSSLNSRNDAFINLLLGEITSGNNTVVAKIIQTSSAFNVEWVDVVENYLPSVSRLCEDKGSSILEDTADKKSILKTKKNLLPGNYEKRFLKTLINKLSSFVNYRYKKLVLEEQDHQNNVVELISNFNSEESNIKVNIRLDIDTPNNLDINIKNVVARAESLTKQCEDLKKSNFMKKMAKTADIDDQVMKTNVLINDSDYKNAYLLWLYFDNYIGNDADNKEKQLKISDEYKQQLLNLIMLSFVTVQANTPNRKLLFVEEDYRTTIANNLNQLSQLTSEIEGTKAGRDGFKDEMMATYSQAFDEYAMNYTDATSRKKVLRDMLGLIDKAYRYLAMIPDDNQDVFKEIIVNNEENLKATLVDYKQKIRMLKDAVSVKEADTEKLKKSIAKMENYVAQYNQKIKDEKQKEILKEKEKVAKEKAKEKEKQQKLKEKAKEKEKQQKLKEKAKSKTVKKSKTDIKKEAEIKYEIVK